MMVLATGAQLGQALAVPPLTPGQQTFSTHDRAGRSLASLRASQHKSHPQVQRRHAVALLSLTFAGLLALNLAFWRHLRRAYASPRRGVWRRD
jgi:hypothetical protein